MSYEPFVEQHDIIQTDTDTRISVRPNADVDDPKYLVIEQESWDVERKTYVPHSTIWLTPAILAMLAEILTRRSNG